MGSSPGPPDSGNSQTELTAGRTEFRLEEIFTLCERPEVQADAPWRAHSKGCLRRSVGEGALATTLRPGLCGGLGSEGPWLH